MDESVTHREIFFRPVAVHLIALGLLSACSSPQTERRTDALLDPARPQYGASYAEWAIEWTKYTTGYDNEWGYPACVSPIEDPTGAHCRDYQDLADPVFFLVGTFGGAAVRDRCVVPRDKALFFPLLSISADTTPDRDPSMTDERMRSYVESGSDLADRASLHLSVDGNDFSGLERGLVHSAPYAVEVPPPPNRWNCDDPTADVEGQFRGFAGGFWAMLPPLPAGRHVIAFGGISNGRIDGMSRDMSRMTIDVRYDLNVE